MLDIVAEAIAFFFETREEHVFDLASVLTWGYVLGPVNQDQVGLATAALGQQGFTSVKAIVRDEGQGLFEIHVSELRIHTLDSFAARSKGWPNSPSRTAFKSSTGAWTPTGARIQSKAAMGTLTRLRPKLPATGSWRSIRPPTPWMHTLCAFCWETPVSGRRLSVRLCGMRRAGFPLE